MTAEPHAEDMLPPGRYQLIDADAGSPARHPLQETFGLTDDEFAILLGNDPDERAERETLLATLSENLVGHLKKDKIGEYLREPQPAGIAADPKYLTKRIPLAVAEEPGGLARVVRDAGRNVGRKIAAERAAGDVAVPVPEAKQA